MKKTVIRKIQEFVETYPTAPKISTRWGEPIVGFASADDALFGRLKSVATPTHAVPKDFLPGARTVIAFSLPFPESLTRTNIPGRLSSIEWGTAYIETNEMIRQLSRFLLENVKNLESIGYADVCGKCLVSVPCSHMDPVARKFQ